MPRGRLGGGCGGRKNSTPQPATAQTMTTKSKSSSEKETPTVVLTALTKNTSNISPYYASSTNCGDNQSVTNDNNNYAAVAVAGREGGRIAVKGRSKREREDMPLQDNYSSTQQNKRKTFHDALSAESSSWGEGANEKIGSVESKSEESSSCGQSDIFDEKITHLVHKVLEHGIASICRLRKLFPSAFFQKFEIDKGDDTTLTKFNEEQIEEILRWSLGEEEEGEDDEEEDEQRSMIKSISTKRSTTLSPLTGASQWPPSQSQYANDKMFQREWEEDADEGRSKWQKRAMEALHLVQWMKSTKSMIQEGKLARVAFSICAGGELIESYSFELTFTEQSHPELQMTQCRESTGSFFRNLNGFSAGMQTVLPSKTQSSALSLYSQESSQYLTQEQSFASSQKHSASHSLGKMAQRSLAMSMSQSVLTSVKKNLGYQIPDSRYLSLDVKFTNEVEVDDLPMVFQEEGVNSLSPVPAVADMDQFVVTPLGSISDIVQMHAYSKRANEAEDDQTVSFSQSQYSRPGQDLEDIEDASAIADSSSSDSDDDIGRAYAVPYNLSGKGVYLQCTILGQRPSKKSRHQELKVLFDNEELYAKGKVKQWIPEKKVQKFTEMNDKITQHLEARCIEGNGARLNITSLDVQNIAEELQVETKAVKLVARKAAIKVVSVEKEEVRRQKK
jgi:hypothetical protein